MFALHEVDQILIVNTIPLHVDRYIIIVFNPLRKIDNPTNYHGNIKCTIYLEKKLSTDFCIFTV
jgi:hypothetical protein